MKKKLTRLFSVLLAAVLVFGTLPISAMGTDVADPPASAADESAVESLVDESSAVDDAAQPEEQSAEVENVATYASNDAFYKIVHLDCGRKYFSKDWIIALLYEMKNDGYNQLQLAFGNDGLRFLLDDMTFTANGKTYESADVVAKVKAGNKTQNSSGDESYLTQSEMDEILAKANELGIEIVPLLNLPGHANAILDIADDQYNASGSNNTLNVADSVEAREFGMAIFKKYVDYFSDKGCRFFNFGADEYANDAAGAFSFSRLNSAQYQAFVSFINDLAGYVISKNMTPRAFNDGFYYNGQNMDVRGNLTNTQVCYWSSGWGDYPVAAASSISANQHQMINTNGDYYYVLGKDDKFDSDYSYASNFSNSAFMGSTISNPVGSMFCIWCDYPNAETETEVAKKTRLVLRAMAQRMDGQTVDVSESVVPGGFNADGTINVPENPNKVTITANGNSDNKLMVGSSIEMAASKSVLWSASSDIVQITPAGGINAYSTDVQATVVNVEALAAGAVTITATDPSDNSNTDSVTLNIVEEDVQEINLAINETYTVKDVDGKYDGSLLADDVATVEGKSETQTTYEKVSNVTVNGSTDYYVSTSPNANDVESNKARLTIEYQNGQYYLKNSDGQYIYPDRTKVTVSSSATAVTVDSYNGYFNVYKNRNYLNVTGNSLSSKTSASNLYFYKYPATTTTTSEITFTGKSTGVTYVTIGDTKYKIIVSPDPLEIEYWITNARVNGNSGVTTAQEVSVSAAAEGIASADGVDVTTLVDSTATRDGRTQEFWQTRLLDTTTANTYGDKTGRQTLTEGDDETNSGAAFTKVRYNESEHKWQVFTSEWTDVETKHQLVSYYLEVLDIANKNNVNELHINAADWGTRADNDTKTYYSWDNHLCSVSVQLVYPDGTTANPAETDFNSLETKSYIYDYVAGGRGIGTMMFTGDNDYQIYKVTATKGTFEYTYTLENYQTTNAELSKQIFTWEKTTNDENKEVLDEVTVWGGTGQTPQDNVSIRNNKNEPSFEGNLGSLAWSCTMGTNDKGLTRNLKVSDGNNAILIRVYVVQKTREDNLHVHYIDGKDNHSIYDYDIKVPEGEYLPNFGMTDDGKGLVNNTITNTSGQDETIEWDLKKMGQIGAEYRYSEYKLVKAYAENNGQDVYLVYNFTNAVSFVVDFGTPLTIKLTDLNAELQNATINNVTVTSQTHGTATVDPETHNITYTPDTRFVSSETGETLQVAVTGTRTIEEKEQTGTVTYQVYIYPASNVLYEENFLENKTEDSAWTEETKVTHTTAQQTQKAGEGDYYTFGYDNSYKGVTSENGKWSITGLTFGERSAPLTTTFYGDTFDLIGECANDSGRVLLLIKRVDVSKNKLVVIDTRYNDGNDGKTVLYQVPLAHVELGEEGTYDVKVYTSGLNAIEDNTTQAVAMMALDDGYTASDDDIAAILEENDLSLDDVEIVTTAMSQDGVSVAAPVVAMSADDAATYATTPVVVHPKGTHVEINGFRVYRSSAVSEKTDDTATAKTVADNYPESEQNQTYWNILDVVKGEIVAYTEADKTAVTAYVQDYEAKGGPQNEIFLTNKNSVQFQIESLAGETIYVSLRAVNGATKYNNNDISSITEMYYPITANVEGIFTIACNGNNMLAIGNVKLPSRVKAEDIKKPSEGSTDALVAALNTVLYGNQEKEVFTPETFTVKTTSTKVIRNKVVTLKINVSSDVAYVTINGVKYTRTGLQGMFQKTRTIRAIYTVPKNDEKTYEIIAYNADDVASEAITKTVK